MRSRQERQGFEAGKKKFVSNLKVWRIYEIVSQGVYYFDQNQKVKEENPTIGIVLCKERDDFVVKYTLPKDNKQIFAKQYQLYLPKKEELIEQIKMVECS
jgi:hypothetical protein